MLQRERKKVFSAGIVFILVLFVVIISIFIKSPLAADNSINGEYGYVIYRYNDKSENQIYIIGLSHRDALTGAPGKTTLNAQIETYKIGEWLIRNNGLELLLPEGFFIREEANKIRMADQSRTTGRQETKAGMHINDGMPEKLLADEKLNINAEMLLRDRYHLDIQQIEDSQLYIDVGKKMARIETTGSDADDFFGLQSELQYLQSLRTARMFQKIPAVVEREYSSGHIKNKKALFTIGLAHIYDIITYLNNNKIAVYPPLFVSAGSKEYSAELDLLQNNFGVTIIIPKTLAEDRKLLIATGLYRMIAR